MRDRKLISMRIETGEVILVETTGIVDDMGFLECWYPFVVKQTKTHRLAIFPWNMLNTEGEKFGIHISRVHYVSGIDDEFRKMYGTIMMGILVTQAKQRLNVVLHQGLGNKNTVDLTLSEISMIAKNINERYNLFISPAELKDQFYEYILDNSTFSTETRQ